jgi:hypothetical protein
MAKPYQNRPGKIIKKGNWKCVGSGIVLKKAPPSNLSRFMKMKITLCGLNAKNIDEGLCNGGKKRPCDGPKQEKKEPALKEFFEREFIP